MMKKIIEKILCNVKYMKMSHVYSYVVSDVLCDINKEYGKITNMTTVWGKIQKYLRMTID